MISLGGHSTPDFTVRYEIVTQSQGLMIGPYTEYQKELSTRILELREQKNSHSTRVGQGIQVIGHRAILARGHIVPLGRYRQPEV